MDARVSSGAGFRAGWQRVLGGLQRVLFSIAQPFAAFLGLILLWQAAIVIFDVPIYIFPAPTDVVRQGLRYAPKIWANYSTTLQSAVLGYLLAVAVAVPGALIIAYSAFAERAFFPGLVVLHMTPKVTLAPLIIAWLGFGVLPKVVVTALLCFMPIMLNGILGFRSLDPEILYLSQSCGARPSLALRDVAKAPLCSSLPACWSHRAAKCTWLAAR